MRRKRRVVLKSIGASLLVPPIVGPGGKEDVVPPEELSRVSTGRFSVEPISKASDFTVTSWNIAYGRKYRRVVESLKTVLRSQIFMLQEVDRMTNRTRDARSGAPRDLPLLFAQHLKMDYAYGLEFQELKQDGPGRLAFTGQETLSAFPLSHPETIRFHHQLADWSRGWLGFWQKRHGGRMSLYCRAYVNGVTLHLYNTHLESRASDEEKLAQVDELLDHISVNARDDEPVIVAGDLNTRQSERSPVVRRLLDHGFEDGLLERLPGRNPTNRGGDRRLDWLFSRNLEVTAASLAPGRLGSDHRAVRVTYRAPGPRPGGPPKAVTP